MALATCLVLAAAGHYAWPAGPSVVADKSVFEPARGERVTFACQLECSGKLSLALCDGAHGVARTLAREEPLDAGGHAFTWDGELDGGSAAPVGTAYYPLLRLERTDGQIEQFDPAPSGGELLLLPDAATSYEQAAGVVRLTLPAAARVLARAGVRDGPVLATLSCWSAFPAGVSTIAWDGWDDSRVLQVPSRKGFFLSLKAVTLPSPCVVVRGRARPARVAPAGKVQWSERRLSLQKQLFAKSAPIAPGYLTLPAIDTPPAFHFRPVEVSPKSVVTYSPAERTMTVEIAADSGEQQRLDQERYEVVACVDLVPVAEDEVGHLPCTMTIPLRGLTRGDHVLSVSVETVSGRASTVSTRVTIGEGQ